MYKLKTFVPIESLKLYFHVQADQGQAIAWFFAAGKKKFLEYKYYKRVVRIVAEALDIKTSFGLIAMAVFLQMSFNRGICSAA